MVQYLFFEIFQKQETIMINEKLEKRSSSQFDVVGIGSALLDIILEAEDALLDKLSLVKGEMKLIDESESRSFMKIIGEMPRQKIPGGSSANTLAGIANLGGAGFFIGSVGTDEYGDLYIMETRGAGVEPLIKKVEGITGHAITFITPDSERTFATHLGAALELTSNDFSDDDISRGKILHLEGYLLEPENLRDASIKAMEIAKRNDMLVSLDLSDPALIGRIGDTFHELVPRYVDILFANETEARAYTGEEEKKALEIMSHEVDYAIVKLGAQGSLIKTGGQVYSIDSFAVEVENTNGAGDMYASGILYGLSRGYDPQKAGTIASYASSKVVAQQGARLTEKLDYSSVVSDG